MASVVSHRLHRRIFLPSFSGLPPCLQLLLRPSCHVRPSLLCAITLALRAHAVCCVLLSFSLALATTPSALCASALHAARFSACSSCCSASACSSPSRSRPRLRQPDGLTFGLQVPHICTPHRLGPPSLLAHASLSLRPCLAAALLLLARPTLFLLACCPHPARPHSLYLLTLPLALFLSLSSLSCLLLFFFFLCCRSFASVPSPSPLSSFFLHCQHLPPVSFSLTLPFQPSFLLLHTTLPAAAHASATPTLLPSASSPFPAKHAASPFPFPKLQS